MRDLKKSINKVLKTLESNIQRHESFGGRMGDCPVTDEDLYFLQMLMKDLALCVVGLLENREKGSEGL